LSAAQRELLGRAEARVIVAGESGEEFGNP
jgi:hypothetical protein